MLRDVDIDVRETNLTVFVRFLSSAACGLGFKELLSILFGFPACLSTTWMSRQWKRVSSRSLEGDFHRYMSSRYFYSVDWAQDKLLSSQSWVNNGFVFAKVYKYLHTQTVKSTNISIPKRTSLQISLNTNRQVYKYLHTQKVKLITSP